MELIRETINPLNETPREIEDPFSCEAKELEDIVFPALMIDFAQSAADVSEEPSAQFFRNGTVLGACFLSATTPLALLQTAPNSALIAAKNGTPDKKMDSPKKKDRDSKQRPTWARLEPLIQS